MSHAENAIEIFQKHVGESEGPGDWHTVDQSQISAFADATLDHQFIHIDPERAKQTPFGTTIAHGFLTLSLLPHLQTSLGTTAREAYQGVAMGINYGLDKVRFPSPVRVDSRVRAGRELISADLVAPNTIQLKHKVTVEIEGQPKPACVAESLTRLVYT
ncbi:MAG: MaoC family dehydratase [Myxococcota bacterium]|nr:MaoC family dehydratase [Myxococcota bacterium]